jgi:hypothetical protein
MALDISEDRARSTSHTSTVCQRPVVGPPFHVHTARVLARFEDCTYYCSIFMNLTAYGIALQLFVQLDQLSDFIFTGAKRADYRA